MHYVIMGCGRVGSFLARTLEDDGHSVAVVDRDESAFRRLPSSFEGRRVLGVGFDRETLISAGIKEAYAFAAVSSGDNSNILAARVARETYGIDHVVARIYDPRRAAIYQRLGIPTVATVQWTSDQVMRRLVPHGSVTNHQDQSGRISVVEIPVNTAWVGTTYAQLEALTNARVVYVSRMGSGLLMQPDLVHQDGDVVHLALETSQLERTEQLLTRTPSPFDSPA